MATTKEVLTRIAEMWITHGEAHQIIGLVADSDPGVLAGALDRMDRTPDHHDPRPGGGDPVNDVEMERLLTRMGEMRITREESSSLLGALTVLAPEAMEKALDNLEAQRLETMKETGK